MRYGVIGVLVAAAFIVSATAAADPVTPEEKSAFIRLLSELPHEGEFLTDAAINRAAPYARVLFALSDKDIEGHDIYPFLALSRGLCDKQKYRRYAVDHFSDISHPMLRMFWAAVLFDAHAASPQVLAFLDAALKDQQQSAQLAELVGPGFEAFRERVYQATRPK